MSNKVNELLNLLRESDLVPASAVASSSPAKQPGAEANRAVSGEEASGLLKGKKDAVGVEKEIEDLDEPMGDALLPEADLLAASGAPVADPAPVADQPKSGEGRGNLSVDAVVSADELEDDIDPEVAEIIRMMGEAEEGDDESEDEEDEGDSEDESEDKEVEEAEAANFNAVDNIGLTEEELKDVVARANAEEEKLESGESESDKEEEKDLPGSEELAPEQKMMIKRLFDESVKDAVQSKVTKAAKLVEEALNRKFKQITLAREEKINEQVSHYLEYVVETWRKQNEPKLFTAAQVKVAKKIFESVKALVETFDIETVDVSAQLIDMYEGKIAKLAEESNKLVSENASLVKEVSLRDRALIIEEAAKGLPLTEIEKFKAVVAKIKAEDLDTFRENVAAMKASFAPRATKKSESINEINETLALQGGIRKEKASVKTDADLIANLILLGIESNK